MQIRPVRPEEYAETAAVVLAAYRALPGGHMTDGYAAELAAVERRAGEVELLVAVDGAVLGSVTFVADPASPWAELLEPGEAGIRMLAVAPEAQGRGVGRRLVDACIDRARASGASALMLHTTPWMTTAQRLYESRGFARFPERDWTPEPDVPLLAYRLVGQPA